MKNKAMPGAVGKVWAFLKKNVFVTAVLLVGLVLILLPTGGGPSEKGAEPRGEPPGAEFSLAEMERHIASALSQIQGAGRVTVVLTLRCGAEQVLAKDTEESSEKSDGRDSPERASNAAQPPSSYRAAGKPRDAEVHISGISRRPGGGRGVDDAAVKLQLVRAVGADGPLQTK